MKSAKLSKKEKKNLLRILIALVLFAAVFIADKIVYLGGVFESPAAWVFPFCLYLAVYLIIGYDVLWRAIRNIAHGQVLDENFLMCLATLGAFALAIYRGVTMPDNIEGFDEACAVLLFYQVGEFFQEYATGKSRKSISALMDIRPDYANVKRGSGTERVDPEEVKVGEVIVVNPGEKVPLDGVVVKGTSALDTKALTGESLPRDIACGDEIVSGSVNLTSQLEVRVTKEFYDSTVSKILELVENASEQKSKAENFITKFAKYYTPVVVGVAVLLAVVPGIVTADWSTWIYRALSFLVVSCPCALVISIPLSFFAGIGAASRCGILVKGSNYLEKFNKANIFVFDKTGTLTKGSFAVTKITPADGVSEEEVLRLAAIAEQNSSHPIAKSVVPRCGKPTAGAFIMKPGTCHSLGGISDPVIRKQAPAAGHHIAMVRIGHYLHERIGIVTVFSGRSRKIQVKTGGEPDLGTQFDPIEQFIHPAQTHIAELRGQIVVIAVNVRFPTGFRIETRQLQSHGRQSQPVRKLPARYSHRRRIGHRMVVVHRGEKYPVGRRGLLRRHQHQIDPVSRGERVSRREFDRITGKAEPA